MGMKTSGKKVSCGNVRGRRMTLVQRDVHRHPTTSSLWGDTATAEIERFCLATAALRVLTPATLPRTLVIRP